MTNKKRILSGIQPTGRLHLGNYLGAVQNWVKLQDEFECFYMIADLHALTTSYEETLSIQEDKYQVALDLISSGIDPKKACIFNQSDVPEHSELHLILSMITPLAWLERVPTYKSKIEEMKEKDLGTYGFLGYPLLQAADILIYKADFVPVGKDQLPHLELTREIARRFNYLYKNVFPEPMEKLTEFPILPGTDGRKMSKSYNNTIPISLPEEESQKIIMSMFTDPRRKTRKDKGHPDVCPVFSYHKIFNAPQRQNEISSACKAAEIGCVECKKEFAGLLINELQKVRSKRNELEKDKNCVLDILASGAKEAQIIAKSTLEEVKKAINLI